MQKKIIYLSDHYKTDTLDHRPGYTFDTPQECEVFDELYNYEFMPRCGEDELSVLQTRELAIMIVNKKEKWLKFLSK